ncbi:MAG TPA: SRPBCC family protein [Solirubrobacterales bacterium]|nr:SRPBCC family protein [Solirubrobacterales bacterium]
MSRKRVLPAAPDRVYDVISDPRRLKEWWPRVTRVEDVDGKAGTARTRWTSVMAADSGRKLRMDYRCTAATRPERYMWEHELEGTPFEDHMVSQTTEIRLKPSGEQTEISLTAKHTLRGSARIAGFMMRKTQREMLDHALDSLERVFEADERGEVTREDESA